MSTKSDNYQPPTYGNWRVPRAAGIGKMSFSVSLGLIGGLVLTVFVSMARGLVAAAGTLVVIGVLVVLATVKDAHQLSVADRIKERVMWWRKKIRKETVFRSGGLSPRNGIGAFELPGILSKVKISSHADPYGRQFAMVEHPSGTVAVVLGASPDGNALVDPEVVDTQVARWGGWLANLSDESGIVGATVTVESAPDSGDRLKQEVRASISDSAPELAKRVMQEIVVAYPQGAAQIRAWITLTFDPEKLGAKSRNMSQIGREIGARLPSLAHSLSQTGAGAVRLVGVTELARTIRIAFDPSAEALFHEAEIEGIDVDIPWSQVGPGYAEQSIDAYMHENAVSKSWTMSIAPRGNVNSNALARLISPHRDVKRKRVTLLFKPIPAAHAVGIVDRDLAQASARRGSSGSESSARATAEYRAAAQTAAEEAAGASLVDFSMIITATASRDDDLRELSATVNSLAASARLLIRPAYGAQDTAFALGLPLGLKPYGDSALSKLGDLV